MAWPDDALAGPDTQLGIAEGVGGKVLFYLALYEATGDPAYLADAAGGADYMLAMFPQQIGNLNVLPIATSMYTGVAGVGFTLNETFVRTGDRRYLDGALRAVQLIHDRATRDSAGAWWSNYNDVLNGSAGTGLFLLYAAREMHHEPSLDLAVAAGHKLMSLAMREHGGLTWKLREDREFVLPNFSHGAAGVGFFLATLYRDTRRAEFLEAAVSSARYLEAVAKTDGGTFVVPYGWPDIGWNRPHDIGWAHGPAGTARFFYRLWQITEDEGWLARVHQSARGAVPNGVNQPIDSVTFGAAPFRIDRRFALGSVAEFFLDLSVATGEQEYLDQAQALTEHIVMQSTRDTVGMRWVVPRYNFMEHAGEVAEFTGYFYGAAGHGLLLLQLDEAMRKERNIIRLPDNPFGR